MRKFLRGVWLIGLGAALILSACVKEEKKPRFTGETSEEPVYQANLNLIFPAAYNNVQGLDLEPGTYISIIGAASSTAYWKAIKAGADQAAADINEALGFTGNARIKMTYNAPNNTGDIDEQVNILDEELARYPDAIAIATVDHEACSVQFDLAAENGIPIVAFSSGNAYQGLQCTVMTNHKEAGKTGAAKLAEEMDDDGQVLLLVYDSKVDACKAQEEGFIQEIEANHPDVIVVETLYCDQMGELKKLIAEERSNKDNGTDAGIITATDIADEDVIAYYLEKHPDIKGCFGTNETATQLAVSAFRQQGLTGEIMVMGFGAGKKQIDGLKKGEIKGLAVPNPFGIGYATVVAAARTVLEIGNEAVVNTGYAWVTMDNIEDVNIKNILY